MNIVKNIVDKTTVTLTVELLAEEMKPYVEKAVKVISQDVKVDGFRPGHVPYDILQKKVGELTIWQEAADYAVQDTLTTAVKREKLDFVGQPKISVEKLAPNNPLVYVATFALMPTVDLKGYEAVRVKPPEVKVDDAKFTQTMDNLRNLRAKHNVVERAAQMKDRVVSDFNVTLAGVPIEGGQGNDVPVVLGENQFIPGFEEQVVGMKAGESKKFMLTFPKDYGAKNLAGRECEFSVTVKSVNEVVLPELDDALAKELNFPSKADLEKAIRENITAELKQKSDDDYEIAVLEAIMAQAEFDPIPEPLLENELDRMMDELRQQIEDQGAKLDEYFKHIKKTAEELRATWKERAEKRIKSALVIKTVADKMNVTVSDEEITTEVEEQKKQYASDPKIVAQLDGLDFRAYTRTVLRNRQALKKLKEIAKQ